ncbi:hypothetical protein ES705_29372 [subsurface metagenome]
MSVVKVKDLLASGAPSSSRVLGPRAISAPRIRPRIANDKGAFSLFGVNIPETLIIVGALAGLGAAALTTVSFITKK